MLHESVWQCENPTQMKNPETDLAAHKSACARVAARFRSRILRSYVASKLRTDPAYPAVFQLVHGSAQPLLDVGCGVGLVAFYLRERGFQNPITGLDRDGRKIRQAKAIAETNYDGLDFREGDVREKPLPFSGNIAILDLLHYLPPPDQQALLLRLADGVADGAVLVLRDCPRSSGGRFWLTYLAEKFAQLISWNVAAPLYFPSSESINENFPPNEFSRENHPLWGATPFNNHLFIFRRHARATVPAWE